MESLWAIIEGAPEAAAALTWKRWLGPAFDAVAAACLRDTKREVKRVPCENGCECNHRVRKAGEFLVGRCDCDEECPDIPLTKADVAVLELRGPLLGRAVADALECDKKTHEFSLRRTWQVAEAGDDSLPVVLTIQPTEENFRTVVAELTARLPDGFILLAPTKQFCNAAIQELLAKSRAGFFDLKSNLTLRPDGSLEADKLGAEWFARVLTKPTAMSATATTAPSEYLIRQEATRQRAGKQDRTMVSTWRVRYRGIEYSLPPLAGSDLVVFLMANQGRNFNASALTEAVRKSNGTGDGIAANAVLFGDDMGEAESGDAKGRVGELHERVLIWDAAEIEKVKGKIIELKDELKQYEDAGDFSSIHYLETKKDLEGWQQGMRLNTKRVGKKLVPKEIQKGTFTLKANLIQKNIRKLLDKHLRNNCRPLYDHLNDKSILKFGVSNSYQPKPRINWVIEMKKGT